MFMKRVNLKPRWVFDTLKSTNNRPIEEFLLMVLANMVTTNRAIIHSIDNEKAPKVIIFERRPNLKLKKKRLS